MKVLVAAASAHGSTEQIASEIAARLADDGLDVEVIALDGTTGPPPDADAAVVGSAVHDMAWLPAATRFVEVNAAVLARRPVWLFSVSSVGDTTSFFGPRVARLMRRMRNEPKTIGRLRTLIGPRAHRNFAGAVARSDWNLVGDLFLTIFGGRYGDHRDHDDITAWADGIAAQLLSRGG